MLQRKSLNNEIPEMTGLLSDYDNNDIPPDSIPPAPPDPWDIDDLLPEEQVSFIHHNKYHKWIHIMKKFVLFFNQNFIL